MLSVFWYCMYT